MNTPLLILIAAVIVMGFFYAVLPFALDAYRHFRHQKSRYLPGYPRAGRGQAQRALGCTHSYFSQARPTRKELYPMAKKEGLRGRLRARKLAVGVEREQP